MTFRYYIGVMLATTSLCWALLFYILFKVDPVDTNVLGFLFFYLSLFLAHLGTFSLVGLFLRIRYNKSELPVFRLVSVSYRQSVLMSTLIVGLLFLQSRGLLTWWNALLFLGLVTFIEFSIASTRGQNKFYH